MGGGLRRGGNVDLSLQSGFLRCLVPGGQAGSHSRLASPLSTLPVAPRSSVSIPVHPFPSRSPFPAVEAISVSVLEAREQGLCPILLTNRTWVPRCRYTAEGGKTWEGSEAPPRCPPQGRLFCPLHLLSGPGHPAAHGGRRRRARSPRKSSFS